MAGSLDVEGRLYVDVGHLYRGLEHPWISVSADESWKQSPTDTEGQLSLGSQTLTSGFLCGGLMSQPLHCSGSSIHTTYVLTCFIITT